MERNIFVNLPVKELSRSIEFFKKLGFELNLDFTNEQAASFIIENNIFVMLLSEDFFKGFIKKEISDTSNSTEVINAISLSSREEVDQIVEKALAAGAKIYRDTDDMGWMYTRAFEDLDGHLWEFTYLEVPTENTNQPVVSI